MDHAMGQVTSSDLDHLLKSRSKSELRSARAFGPCGVRGRPEWGSPCVDSGSAVHSCSEMVALHTGWLEDGL